MISLAATEFDIDGAVILDRVKKSSRPFERSRRVNRTATLDGSAVFTDTGFSDADRTIVVVQNGISQTLYDIIVNLFENYDLIIICTTDGAFEGALSTLSVREGELTLNLLVKQKISN